jgi:aldose 1-epimerase
VQTTATNVGRDPCPYGSGAHPYLGLGTATVDGLFLQMPGRTFMRSDERGPTKLDHAFTDLERDEEAPARVEIRITEHRSRSRSTGASHT